MYLLVYKDFHYLKVTSCRRWDHPESEFQVLENGSWVRYLQSAFSEKKPCPVLSLVRGLKTGEHINFVVDQLFIP